MPTLFARPPFKWVTLALLAAIAPACAATMPGDWSSYGYNSGGGRYSPLAQITPENVGQLQVAWTYHMNPDYPALTIRSSTTTPIVADGRMYIGTPFGRVVALDPTTGQELWTYTLQDNDQPALRGVGYWPGDREHGARLIFGTAGGNIIALNAASGLPAKDFGLDGIVDTKTPEIMNGFPEDRYSYSAPPTFFKNLAIFGSRVQETGAKGPAGDVRAWDVITGKLIWTFHSVPRPGEFGYETWENESGHNRTGVNMWNMATVDQERGIVYLAFGAPTYDRYGGDRPGANLFASSIVAVAADSGKYMWHFQTVHHDIWDYDQPAPPTLLTVTHGGEEIPAVAALNKTGLLFLLNRLTGEPIYGVTEVPVRRATAPGEVAWPTQPVPNKPGPVARMSFDFGDLADITPELTAACQALIDKDGGAVGTAMFDPLRADRPTIRFPGSAGGVVWGGGAFDPRLGYFLFNSNNMGNVEKINQGSDGEWLHLGGRFRDPVTRSPCQKPPWGELIAVDVNTGDVAWRSVLGVSDDFPAGKQNTGRPGTGGPIVTAAGLLFIGATDDRRFRAFETRTGRELWSYTLDYAAHATPISYEGKDGRQYVAVVATGGSVLGSPAGGDSVVVFALPTAGSTIQEVSAASPVETREVSAASPAGPASPTSSFLTGQSLLQAKCSGCHSESLITSQQKTREGWAETVYSMLSFGASLTNAEADRVIDYLTESHGVAH